MKLTKFSAIKEASPEKGVNEITWDAPVHLERLQTASGLISDDFGVVATGADGTQKLVGGYRGEACLLSNEKLVNSVRLGLEKAGWKTEEEFKTLKNGSIFQGTFSLIGQDFDLIHSPVRPQLTVWNSYNGFISVSGEFGAKVLKCWNGMTGTEVVASLVKKHSSLLDVSSLAAKFENVIREGISASKTLEKLNEIALPENKVLNLFSNLAKLSKGKISLRLAGQMNNYFWTPDDNEKALPSTLWRAYMASTRAIRDLEGNRPTVSESANVALGLLFGMAARKDHKTLLAAPEPAFDLGTVLDV